MIKICDLISIHHSKATISSPFSTVNPTGKSKVIVHSSPVFTSPISFLNTLMLLGNSSLVIGVPFLNTYILWAFVIFPLETRRPGTTIGSSPGFLPLILKTSATSARPFSTPLIMAPFLRAMADSSKSLRKLWMSLCTLGMSLWAFCISTASLFTYTPKVNIYALQVTASSMSLAVTSPMSDLSTFTVISFFSLRRWMIGSICSWMVSSTPRSAERMMTLKLLLLMPMFTRNWYTYCLWLANCSSFSLIRSSNLGLVEASCLISSIFSTISFSFSANLASQAQLVADPYMDFLVRQSRRIFAVLTVFFSCSLLSAC